VPGPSGPIYRQEVDKPKTTPERGTDQKTDWTTRVRPAPSASGLIPAGQGRKLSRPSAVVQAIQELGGRRTRQPAAPAALFRTFPAALPDSRGVTRAVDQRATISPLERSLLALDRFAFSTTCLLPAFPLSGSSGTLNDFLTCSGQALASTGPAPARRRSIRANERRSPKVSQRMVETTHLTVAPVGTGPGWWRCSERGVMTHRKWSGGGKETHDVGTEQTRRRVGGLVGASVGAPEFRRNRDG